MKQNRKLSLIPFTVMVPWLLVSAGCNNDSSTSTKPAVTMDQSTNAATVASADADNTAKNQRDQTNGTLTPGDQGNSDADRAITQRIRQAVVSSTNNLSVTAQNIKIITVDGKVTLRGPVNNDSEKTNIDGIAKSVAGDGNVDDQLEVKSSQ